MTKPNEIRYNPLRLESGFDLTPQRLVNLNSSTQPKAALQFCQNQHDWVSHYLFFKMTGRSQNLTWDFTQPFTTTGAPQG